MMVGSPTLYITTVQCSICSQLNNKPRVVVTDARYLQLSTKWLLLEAYSQCIPRLNTSVHEYAHLIHVHVH